MKACVLLLTIFLYGATGTLFEDQVGLFDWHKKYIGSPKFVVPLGNMPYVIIATDRNVVASVEVETGLINWRQVLENDIQDNGINLAFQAANTANVLTLSSGGTNLRAFNVETGTIDYSLSLKQSKRCDSYNNEFRHFISDDKSLLLISDRCGMLSLFSTTNSQLLWQTNAPEGVIELVSIIGDDVVVLSSRNKLLSVSYFNVKNSALRIQEEVTKLDQDLTECELVRERGSAICLSKNSNLIVVNLKVGKLVGASNGSELECLKSEIGMKLINCANRGCSDIVFTCPGKGTYSASMSSTDLKMYDVKKLMDNDRAGVWYNENSVWLVGGGSDPHTRNIFLQHEASLKDISGSKLHIIGTSNTGAVEKIFAWKQWQGAKQFSLIVTKSDALLFIKNDKLLWRREEGLSSLTNSVFCELPESELEILIEDEFVTRSVTKITEPAKILSDFIRRCKMQVLQLREFVSSTVSKLRKLILLGEMVTERERFLQRNAFNTHKLIIGVSEKNAIYGIDSRSGSLVWTSYLGAEYRCVKLTPAAQDSCKYPIIIQRVNAPHPFSKSPKAIVIGEIDGKAVITEFNPLTGEIEGFKSLEEKISALAILPFTSEDYEEVVAILKADQTIMVLPDNATSLTKVSNFISNKLFFSYVKADGTVIGCKAKFINQRIMCESSWNRNVLTNDKYIVAVKSAIVGEKVNTDARIVAEDQLLYKYVNPNLMAIVTIGEDENSRSSLTVRVFDAVSGNDVQQAYHRRASPPVNVIISENWVIYTFWNDLRRSNEVTVMDFYVGNKKLSGDSSLLSESEQLSSSKWLSSFKNPVVQPSIESQAFSIRGIIRTLGVSITTKGITHKSLYFGMADGAILEIPKIIIEPRRKVFMSTDSREEGVMPYAPELPYVSENMVNYNQTVYRIKSIHCGKAGLESITLLFAHGLDLFFTQSAPSQRFDVLKDDFDYIALSGVLLILLIATIISRKMSKEKVLKRLWK